MSAATCVVVEPPARRGHPVRVRTRAGLLAPRVLRLSETGASVALVATHALLLDGDDLTIEVAVEEGVELDLTDIAATVAYRGEGRGATWRATVTVADRARLTWWGEPFVISTGAVVRRDLAMDVAASGGALVRDTVVLGRAGERGGRLTARTRIRVGDVPAVVEDLRLDGQAPVRGVMGGHRVLDQLMAVGDVELPRPAHGARRFQHAHAATTERWLGRQVHESPLSARRGETFNSRET